MAVLNTKIGEVENKIPDVSGLAITVVLKDTLKTSKNFKNKRVWSNVFWYVKVCIFWKRIPYTIHWDKTQMLNEICLDRMSSTKTYPLFPFVSSNSPLF